MKVVIINKSDSTGGAAVVSRRLMEALRQEGVDARMLVCEKLTDSPFVEVAASSFQIKRNFLLERLKIYIANGFNRSTLFKIDTGEYGLPLWKHPLVKDTDAILINWINQGMLSLKGVRKLLKLGKPVIWTMHDMWCLTGICHHAGLCEHYFRECGNCGFLLSKAANDDLSKKVWKRKNLIYRDVSLTKKLAFVPVSQWLRKKAEQSSLLGKSTLRVIPNAFKLSSGKDLLWDKENIEEKKKIRLLFGAARLDDPIKGFDTFRLATKKIAELYPKLKGKMEVAVFGNVKNPDTMEGFSLPVINLGILKGEKAIEEAYRASDIVISASSYETLPGTMVEAQAYGCIPVSFNRGGQSDIIKDNSTGFLTEYDEDIEKRAINLAKGIVKASEVIENKEQHSEMVKRMRENVEKNFSYKEVAGKYLQLIEDLNR